MTIRHFLTAILAFSISVVSLAQVKTDGKATDIDGVVRIDRTIWDFGDVTVEQGPLSCTFKVTNISDSPAVIYNVVSSCGCTDVKWTREPLRPGASGTIDATYSNDEGPYPFDKNLTVYISGVKKPVILRLRGTAHSRKMPLSELYPVRRGFLGLKSDDIKLGNLSQGSIRAIVSMTDGDWALGRRNTPLNANTSMIPPFSAPVKRDFSRKHCKFKYICFLW